MPPETFLFFMLNIFAGKKELEIEFFFVKIFNIEFCAFYFFKNPFATKIILFNKTLISKRMEDRFKWKK